jgi:hypothetical protein
MPKDTDLVGFFASEKCKVKVAVITDCYRQGFDKSKLIEINEKCRARTQMIIADNNGLFSRIITDLGPTHNVIDSNGEPATESMIDSVEPKGNQAIVTLIKGALHGLQEGDTVEFAEVKGM